MKKLAHNIQVNCPYPRVSAFRSPASVLSTHLSSLTLPADHSMKNDLFTLGLLGFLASLILCNVSLSSNAAPFRPVVLMHGITGNYHDFDEVKKWIEDEFPGIYVLSMEIGDLPDLDSIFMTMSDQVDEFCTKVKANPNLQKGFNLIGHSQGTLVARGYIERCNNPPVYNFISWAGPQAGQFGVPFTNIEWIDKIVSEAPYDKEIQKKFSFAQYWRNPFDLTSYLDKSLFLADINNEREIKNQTYKDHILSLNKMLLIYSTVDTLIKPRESGWFSFWQAGSDTVLVPVQERALWKEDWLGLRALYESQRLIFDKTNCTHGGHTEKECKHFFDVQTYPLLDNYIEGWNEYPDPKWTFRY